MLLLKNVIKDVILLFSDNGVGATDKQINKLNNSPHYMVCDENTSEQCHGLGLLIVKQIAAAHQGTIEIRHSEYGGFEVKICLPSYSIQNPKTGK